jgi:PAS domain S-box-containing protein
MSTEVTPLDERQLLAAKEYAEAIVDTVRDPLLVLDHELRVRTANRAFYQTFQVAPQETEGCLIYDLGNRQWDIPQLRRLLEEILPTNSVFKDFEVEHNFEHLGPRTMHLNARRLNTVPLILLAIEDITERKQTEEAHQAFHELLEQRVAEGTKQVHDLAAQLLYIEEQVRQRMAQILHDNLQQLLYGAKMHLKILHDELQAEAVSPVSTSIAQLDHIVAEALIVTRQLTGDLIPTSADNDDLVQLLHRLANRKQQLYGLSVTVEAETALPPVPDVNVRHLLYQCVRELLFNVVKHAGVKEARVIIGCVGEDLRILVEDAGSGFVVDHVLQSTGHEHRSYGLAFVRSRLTWQEGRLEVASAPGQGTRMMIHFPLARLRPRTTKSGEGQL